MQNIELVVFDMSGTTIEDRGQVAGAFQEALQAHGIAATPEQIQATRGASKREALRVHVERQFGRDDPHNAQRVTQLYATFRQALESRYTGGETRPVAGAEQTFEWLHERGVRVALTTGFYRRVVQIILQAVGWDKGDLVDASLCSDDVPQGRPAPYMIFRAMEAASVHDVRCVVKVGDTALDLQAGRNAGAGWVVGVLSGSQGVAQLGRVAHTHLIPSVAELPSLLTEKTKSRIL